MKTITTKIPNTEKKGNYALIHIETFDAINKYLDELLDPEKDWDIEDWVSEVRNELEGLRRI